jgi:NADPH:quinone reductase-like Zn-dependent oxidoreductase
MYVAPRSPCPLATPSTTFLQILQAQGRYQTQPPRPFILGTEFAGTVAAAPAGSPFKRGDRVFGSAQGSLAERVVAKSDLVLPLPDTLSFDQGAGMFRVPILHCERLVDKQVGLDRAICDISDEL